MTVNALANDCLTMEIADGVALLRLNRPDTLNALDDDLQAALLGATEALKADPSVRVIILTGNGKGFCSGAGLDPTQTADTPAGLVAQGNTSYSTMTGFLNPIVANLTSMPKVVITAINGVAAGGGMGLALAGDIVLAARSARFVQVFVPKLGILPDMGSTWVLPRLIGSARARALMLTGLPVSAEQAASWGMIWQAVDDDQLLNEARALAARFASYSPRAIKALKQALSASAANTFSEQLQLEAEIQRERVGSSDFTEGVRAFLDKRPPQFELG
jgi:2-(1,2-epoxy-1,2-dihydrophenyl)acetyl-CoA isomerase